MRVQAGGPVHGRQGPLRQSRPQQDVRPLGGQVQGARVQRSRRFCLDVAGKHWPSCREV